MSNVIRLNAPSRQDTRADRCAALIAAFAGHRRSQGDVFWLKENAELLNVLECTGARLDPEALAPHRVFHERIEQFLEFFPQYYRFVLSICLDLEALGLPGGKSEGLIAHAAREGLAEAEMSDLQRLEAQRLMRRRGVDPFSWDAALDARVRRFMDRPETFAVPNRKAGYELTHIVFYLSEYGRRDPQLSTSARTSLEFAGILAHLDRNADMLAEVCVAMRYSGAVPPPVWEAWLEREIPRFRVQTGAESLIPDDYHDFLMCNWSLAAAGGESFSGRMGSGRIAFHRADPGPSALREISEHLYRLGRGRREDWEVMRPGIEDALSQGSRDVLAEACAGSARFPEFFAGFARAGASWRGTGAPPVGQAGLTPF